MPNEAAPKITPAQRAVLQNLAAGRLAAHHLRGLSEMGGFERTRISLLRAGLIRCSYGACISIDITDAGRAALAQSTT